MKKVHNIKIDGHDVSIQQEGDYFKTIYPFKDSKGNIIWKNLIAGGSWKNLGWIALIVAGILLGAYEYADKVSMLQECLASPNLLDFFN